MINTRTGHFRDTELTDLISELQRNRATGSLTLRRPAEEKSIYLKDGRIAFAASTLERDRLGEMLLRKGLVTPSQHDKASQVLNESGRRFGAILVELGFVRPQELFEAVQQQVQEIVISVFHWDDGDYLFVPGELPEPAVPLPLDAEKLIGEIIRQLEQETTSP